MQITSSELVFTNKTVCVCLCVQDKCDCVYVCVLLSIKVKKQKQKPLDMLSYKSAVIMCKHLKTSCRFRINSRNGGNKLISEKVCSSCCSAG